MCVSLALNLVVVRCGSAAGPPPRAGLPCQALQGEGTGATKAGGWGQRAHSRPGHQAAGIKQLSSTANPGRRAQDKNVRLADENRALDGKASEARAIESRAVLQRLEWQHEREVLQRHCARLNEELGQKLDAHTALRAASSAEARPRHVSHAQCCPARVCALWGWTPVCSSTDAWCWWLLWVWQGLARAARPWASA